MLWRTLCLTLNFQTVVFKTESKLTARKAKSKCLTSVEREKTSQQLGINNLRFSSTFHDRSYSQQREGKMKANDAVCSN